MRVMSLSDFSETVCWKLNPMWFIRVTILDDVLMSAFTGYSLSDHNISAPISQNTMVDFVRFAKIYKNCSEILNTRFASFEF